MIGRWNPIPLIPNNRLHPQGFMASERPQWSVALRVLVVDDDPDTAESLALMLRLYGYEVSIALDGPSALQAAEAYWPDVVLLDVLMPGMDGRQVLKRLREATGARKPPQVVAVTGYGQAAELPQLLQDGFAYYFLKPADPAVLLAWLRSVGRAQQSPAAEPPTASVNCGR
jgi:two-component system CheB/CheR fusion protein